MSNGPTHSNRTFKLMRTTTLSEGEYIIETWQGSNYDKERGTRTEVPGALDIKIYNKDTSKEYNKGDAVIFFRVFENDKSSKGNIPQHQQSAAAKNNEPVNLAAEQLNDDEIPF